MQASLKFSAKCGVSVSGAGLGSAVASGGSSVVLQR